MPALAAGAGLVGLAGGVILGARNSSGRVLGMPLPSRSGTRVSKNLAEATKNVGSLGEGMSSLAAELHKVQGGNGEGGRSPIEVVLQGLTRRS
jgi:hypothetical protein